MRLNGQNICLVFPFFGPLFKKKKKKKKEEEKEEALFRSVANTDVALLSEPFFVSRHTSKATIVKT